MGLRRCIDCSYVFKVRSNNQKVRCEQCWKKHRKETRQRRREKPEVRDHFNHKRRERFKNDLSYKLELRLKVTARNYGITVDEVKELRSVSSCQICNRKEHLCIDHDHNTGLVRGVVCSSCNTLLAGVDKDGWLDKALIYLRKG